MRNIFNELSAAACTTGMMRGKIDFQAVMSCIRSFEVRVPAGFSSARFAAAVVSVHRRWEAENEIA